MKKPTHFYIILSVNLVLWRGFFTLNNLEIEKEFALLSKELNVLFSKEQIIQWAKETKFLQRESKLKPEQFLLLCTIIGENSSEKSLVELCSQLSTIFGVNISAEGLNQRYTAKAVEFIKKLFLTVFSKKMGYKYNFEDQQKFKRICILDSTSFDLPGDYKDYKGPNGSGIKIQLEYELYSGEFLNLEVQDGISSDSYYPRNLYENIQKGDLYLRDLGYYSSDNLKIINQKGGYYISRLKNNINIYKLENDKWVKFDPLAVTAKLNPGEVLELDNIRIGANNKDPLLSRVVLVRLTDEQIEKKKSQIKKKKKKGKSTLSSEINISTNIYVTNIPQVLIKKEEIYSIYSLRWQIEILFKTWKSLFNIHKVKKMKKERFECYLYGTLVRLLLSSTLAFQIKRALYKRNQVEVSEYKAINIAKEGIKRFVEVITHSTITFEEVMIRVYRTIATNGRMSYKKNKRTVFDILNIVYKKTFKTAGLV